MKIAVVSKATSPGGGASRIAEDLAALLRNAGHEADHWVGYYSGAPRDSLHQLHGSIARPVVRLAHRLAARLGRQEFWPLEWGVFGKRVRQYDVVHFHDTMLSAAPATVARTAATVPTAWTLHDCSPFTGGCLWPLDCDKFTNTCGACPQHGTWPLTGLLDGSRVLRKHKKRLFAESTVTPVAPSAWMASLAERSGMFGRRAEVLPNGIDTDTFIPAGKRHLRQHLGLPEDAFIVLMASGSLDNPYKGTRLGIQALRAFRDATGTAPHILLVGLVSDETAHAFEDFPVRSTGYLYANAEQAMHYAAADILLYPSLADNHPLTVIEAMACGTPVIGFNSGGIPEIVRHGESGHLSPTGDIMGLVQGLTAALDNATRQAWSACARAEAVTRFSQGLFLQRHLDLYRRLTADRRLPNA